MEAAATHSRVANRAAFIMSSVTALAIWAAFDIGVGTDGIASSGVRALAWKLTAIGAPFACVVVLTILAAVLPRLAIGASIYYSGRLVVFRRAPDSRLASQSIWSLIYLSVLLTGGFPSRGLPPGIMQAIQRVMFLPAILIVLGFIFYSAICPFDADEMDIGGLSNEHIQPTPVTVDEDQCPMPREHRKSLMRGVAFGLLWVAALFLVRSMLAVPTPRPVSQAFSRSAQVLSRSLGGSAVVYSLRSTAIESDAGVSDPANDENKETAAHALTVMGHAPYIANISVHGWGLPGSDYRVWAQFQPLFSATVAERGITVDEVASDKDRMSTLIAGILSACDMSGDYDVNELVASAKVVPDCTGDGVVALAVSLPQTEHSSSAGSLGVVLGRDWQIESFDLWTSGTYMYEHPGQ